VLNVRPWRGRGLRVRPRSAGVVNRMGLPSTQSPGRPLRYLSSSTSRLLIYTVDLFRWSVLTIEPNPTPPPSARYGPAACSPQGGPSGDATIGC